MKKSAPFFITPHLMDNALTSAQGELQVAEFARIQLVKPTGLAQISPRAHRQRPGKTCIHHNQNEKEQIANY